MLFANVVVTIISNTSSLCKFLYERRYFFCLILFTLPFLLFTVFYVCDLLISLLSY